MVPLSASSNRPSRRSAAPVKAPFSWPNSSLSSRVSGSAAQLTAMNGLPAPGREVVDALGHQLLAGAALALDQHRARDRRHLLDLDQHLLDRGALADDPGALLQLPRRSISRRAVATASSGATGFIIVSVTPSRPTRSARSESVGSSRARVEISASRARAASWSACGSCTAAGQDHQLGALAADGAAGVVQRGEHGGGEAGRLERRVERHGGREVVHRDEDAGGGHGREYRLTERTERTERGRLRSA